MASFLKEQVCDFLTIGEKINYKPCYSMTVSARTHAHLSAAAQGERIGPSPPFLFPAGLDRLLVVADPSCLASGGVIAALRSKSSTLGPRARRGELGLTAVAFSLSIRSHLHLGFAFRPREHLLAQAVHQVAPAGRTARIQRVFLVLPRGRPPESSSNAPATGGNATADRQGKLHDGRVTYRRTSTIHGGGTATFGSTFAISGNGFLTPLMART